MSINQNDSHKVALFPGPSKQVIGAGALALTFALALLVGACDFSVTNPGPVQDEYLDDASAHPGMVNGMGRKLSDAVNFVTLVDGAVANEITGAGNIVSFGISLKEREGIIDSVDAVDQWDRAQSARWYAENGAKRMEETVGSETWVSYELGAQALLYAAYTNRLMGENFCQAVFDGGSVEPRSEYFVRADSQFTKALEIAQNAGADQIATAARAGRASVRAWLGDWGSAVADAQQIPDDFFYGAEMTSTTIPEYNRVYWAVANSPYRTISVYDTFYDQYYNETGDPRTPWDTLAGFPCGDSGECVPFYRQLKYTAVTDPIALSTGDEMRLLIAEDHLREGAWEDAMDIINTIRAEVGVDPWDASNLEEAWSRLKRERGIELWLEGRRLWDLHRWRENNTPGANPDDTGQDTCYPIARSEIVTNPNLP